MNLQTPKNPNYCATVVEIKSIIELENCDNVVATPIFGFQAIVGKNTKVGDIGIVFPAETRLSDEYCRANNLYRHNEQNVDVTQKGYLEDNRRLKAVKFRGHRSDCLFMPLSSLYIPGVDAAELEVGDEFDELNGHLICEKYERPVNLSRAQKIQKKAFSRVDKKFLPEHYDNENYFKNEGTINENRELIVTQKLHGTSIRVGNTIVARELGIFERVVSLLGVNIAKTEFAYVFGSRRVIKDPNNPRQVHYYEEDIWTTEGKKLEGMIPENYLVYAELVGYTATGTAIQADYTYRQEPGTCKLYVYRVAFINAQGIICDLSWDQVREFCQQRSLSHVPELWRGQKSKFDVSKFIDKRFFDMKRTKFTDSPIQLDDDQELVDEGVCIRVDGIMPMIYKAKSPIFLQHESKVIDQGGEDLESEEATNREETTE